MHNNKILKMSENIQNPQQAENIDSPKTQKIKESLTKVNKISDEYKEMMQKINSHIDSLREYMENIEEGCQIIENCEYHIGKLAEKLTQN